MADIFEEVEESLRQDRFSTLWKKYGILAYIGAALIIGGVALNEYLNTTGQETTVRNAEVLEAALTDIDLGNYEQAAAALEVLADSDAAISPIASHYLARVQLDANGDAALAAETLSSSGAAGRTPSDKLALLKAAYSRADTLSRGDLEAMLTPLRVEDSAFNALALELLAAKALQEGDTEYARTEFNFLQLAPNVPSGTAQRAAMALAALPPLAEEDAMIVDVDPIVEETPAAPVEETEE